MGAELQILSSGAPSQERSELRGSMGDAAMAEATVDWEAVLAAAEAARRKGGLPKSRIPQYLA
jgi:hypothetical protein